MLKYIAIITMLLDHINKIVLNNEYYILEVIGRLSFPLFIYLAVSSYIYHTKSKENYIIRLFYFAILSTPFYIYAFELIYFPLNIFFSLFLGLIAIYMIEKQYYLFVWLPFVFALYSEYSFFGIVCFVSFYVFLKYRDISSVIILFISLFLLNPYYLNMYIPIFFILIYLDLNYKINFKSFLNKYVFYIFYPLHITILGLLK